MILMDELCRKDLSLKPRGCHASSTEKSTEYGYIEGTGSVDASDLSLESGGCLALSNERSIDVKMGNRYQYFFGYRYLYFSTDTQTNT